MEKMDKISKTRIIAETAQKLQGIYRQDEVKRVVETFIGLVMDYAAKGHPTNFQPFCTFTVTRYPGATWTNAFGDGMQFRTRPRYHMGIRISSTRRNNFVIMGE